MSKKFHISRMWKSLAISIALLFAADYFHISFLTFVTFCSWCYSSFLVYRKAFRWINSQNMGNDLTFFGLKLLSGVMLFFITIFTWSFIFAFLTTPNSAIASIPFVTLLGGLWLLCLFIVFRTDRRHHIVGIWNAN